jgi:hypothetical protein
MYVSLTGTVVPVFAVDNTPFCGMPVFISPPGALIFTTEP